MKKSLILTNLIVTLTITIVLIITGCGESIKLLTIDDSSINQKQDFKYGQHKVIMSVTQVDNKNNYVCSLQFDSKLKLETLRNINSTLSIVKYSSHPTHKNAHKNNNRMIKDDIKPTIEPTNDKIDFNYEIEDAGKYKITILLSEISGDDSTEKVQITFDQIVH
jgi:hypothetical protein